MCGFTGVLYRDKEKQLNSNILQSMTDSLAHRGPDDEGIYINKNVGLGFRRLSIIDLEHGHQPLSNKKETIWIVFNGEIYNYPELRADLIKKGYEFKTNCDTETIAHMYEEYGFNCLDYFIGMFSFIIYDSVKNILFCARDRLGKKPFYYYWDSKKFIFSSEIKAILQHPKIDQSLNSAAINEYFTYGYVSANKTAYKNIKKLLPGHYMVVNVTDSREFIEKPYWHLNSVQDNRKTEKDWMEIITDTFTDSVKKRLVSDVPVGAFLSGGIDSSIVVAIMSKLSSEKVKTFSIGFEDQPFNELEFAREISKKYDTEHYEEVLSPSSIEILPELVNAFDEPFADSSAIPTYFVSKFAHQHVKVVLSGDGGDELFSGYNHYQRFLNISRYNFIPYPLNKYIFMQMLDILPNSLRGKKMLHYFAQKKNSAYAYSSNWHSYERNHLYNDGFKAQLKLAEPETNREKLIMDLNKSHSLLTSLQLSDIKTYLVDDILAKVDRSSMANSLEVRSPILDHRVVELAFKIPENFKVKNGIRKYIFKETFKDLLTKKVLNHKKQGFVIPVSVWFKGDLKDYINDILSQKNNIIYDYFDFKYLNRIKKIHFSGRRDFNTKLWSIIFFEAWLRNRKN